MLYINIGKITGLLYMETANFDNGSKRQTLSAGFRYCLQVYLWTVTDILYIQTKFSRNILTDSQFRAIL